MKTVSTREFIHTPGLVKCLRPGQSLLVTDNGKPSFTVTKAGKRAVRTLEDVEREAREISPRERPTVNLTRKIANLRK